MKNGKKTYANEIAQNVFLRLSIHHAKRTNTWVPGSILFNKAIENVQPIFEIRKYRKGGTTQFLPVPCPLSRQRSLAFRWILEAARQEKKIDLSFSLAQILYASFCREGKVFQKRNENHKLAEAHRMSIRG